MRTTLALLLLLAGCADGPATSSDDTDVDSDTALVDADEDGSPAGEDCDDEDFERTPGADEYCDGKDNDCDEIVDEEAVDADTFYADLDRDGFGDDNNTTLACELPPDSAERGGDCNDEDDSIHPEATEVCDEADVDEDCDGKADDLDDSTDRASMGTWHVDEDLDGYGDPERTTLACDAAEGRTLDATDCDDKDPEAKPRDGCEVDWDGSWSVEGTVTVTLSEKGLTDRCSFTLDVTIDSSSRETVRTTSRSVCAMRNLGTKDEAWIRGSFASDSTLTGELYVGKTTIPYEAKLTPAPDTLDASGKDTLVFAGYKSTVEHTLKGTR